MIFIAILIALSFVPSLAFLGPWDKSGELYKYLALTIPLSVYPLLKKLPSLHFDKNKSQIKFEILVLIAVTLFFINHHSQSYIPYFFNPVETDIGQSTVDAVNATFNGHNPYSSQITHSYNLGRGYAGFKYGPGMIISYAPLAMLPPWGLKLVNLIYLSLFLIFGIYLISDKNSSKLINVRNSTAFICCIFSLKVLWVELFKRGVVDIAPVCFVVITLYCVKNNSLLIAGIFAALSIACKPAIGLAVGIILIAQFYSNRALFGFIIGTVPWLIFFLLDARALLRNTLYFHLLKAKDLSTVYHYLHQTIKPAFALFIFLLVAYSVFYKRSEKSWQRLLFTSCSMLVLSMVLFKHIHNNHSLWIFPLVPLLLIDSLLLKRTNYST